METYNFDTKRYIMETVTNDIEALKTFKINSIASDSNNQILVTGLEKSADGDLGLKVFRLTKKPISETGSNAPGRDYF